MIEVDTKRYLKSFQRQERCAFITISHRDLALNTDKLFGRMLFDEAGRLKQKYERRCTTIHDGNFGGSNINVRIINTETRHC